MTVSGHASSKQKYKRLGWTAAVLVLCGAMVAGTTFVSNKDQLIASDTAAEFAELNFIPIMVPAITSNAIPVTDLATKYLADPEATGAEHGRKEGEGKPYSFPVAATGTVIEGAFGEVGLELTDMPNDMTVGIAIPPLGSSTALRDAGAEVVFGDFANQTEYQNVAIELNKLAVETVYGDLDPKSLVGKQVSVKGATTWFSKTGGDVTHLSIVPVSIEVQ